MATPTKQEVNDALRSVRDLARRFLAECDGCKDAQIDETVSECVGHHEEIIQCLGSMARDLDKAVLQIGKVANEIHRVDEVRGRVDANLAAARERAT